MNDGKNNPLLTAQQHFLNSLSPTERNHFFSSTHVTPERRAEIWEEQADLGETLVNSYAWATPDPRLIKVFQHFAPIVEVGCGANAYWSRWMNAVGGVDVIAPMQVWMMVENCRHKTVRECLKRTTMIVIPKHTN
jgi:hypothetical protein